MRTERADSVLPSGTVTFLFSDIEGSTTLWDRHTPEMATALARHDEILRTSIAAKGGHVFATTGDGLAAAFHTAAAAVAAAVDAQRALEDESWPRPVEIGVRMGIHTGEAHERQGDYFGPVVNRSARLMSAAHGGQIVVSALTASLVRLHLPVEFIDLGTVVLRGLTEPEHVMGVRAEGLEWRDVPLSSARVTKGNLPWPPSAYVGDITEIAERVTAELDHRIVTITGSGGVGKTRAALEIGRVIEDRFLDGIWFVELAAVSEPGGVATAIATTLGVQASEGSTIDAAIVEWCRGRRMLLVVDNCEHLLDEVCSVVRILTTQCPMLNVLTTSREPLGVGGEQVIRLPSLGPDESLDLFLQRATAADSRFEPSLSEREVIAAICARLDGIPLAIELAAARIRSLAPGELLDRLDDRFVVLRGGRGGLERHQTLRAAVSWSYQLLGEPARVLFARSSVFHGTFDLAAAEAVCAGTVIDADDVIDLVAELVDKSIVTADRTAGGTRYRLLETLRQYGEERLDDIGEAAAIRSAHLLYYADLAGRLHRERLGPGQLAADAVYEREWGNLRAALHWAIVSGDVDRAEDLVVHTTWYAQARIRHDHQDWARRTLEMGGAAGANRSRVYASASWWLNVNDDIPGAIALARRGLEVAVDSNGRGHSATNLFHWMRAGYRDAAELSPILEEASRQATDIDVRWAASQALLVSRLTKRDGPQRLEHFVRLCHEIGGPAYVSSAHLYTGMLECFSPTAPDLAVGLSELQRAASIDDGSLFGNTIASTMQATALVMSRHSDAGRVLASVIAEAYDARFWPMLRQALEVCAFHLALGTETDMEGAATLLGYLEDWSPQGGGIGLRARSATRKAVAEFPDAGELAHAGAALDRHEAVAYALSRLPPVSSSARVSRDLTDSNH